jgi:alpha-D-ribose 1-methylphosphonate 5-triphosphate synthase subunit PhnI
MYVAARGGEAAIQNAEQLYRDLIGEFDAGAVRLIERAMPYLIDRVMGEGSLYAPELAALALAQSGGDLYEAVLMLRAFRSTQPRIAYAQPAHAQGMRTVRRISAAFKDIPGGQVLGPTLDYSHRILQLEKLDDGLMTTNDASAHLPVVDSQSPIGQHAASLPAVADWQRDAGLLPPLPRHEPIAPNDVPDVTREPLLIPADRAVRLQSLSRADTGGVLALGYANMRGYGSVHPTVNEVRLGYVDVQIAHPITGEPFSLGRIRVSQAEVVTTFKGASDKPQLALGFCATLGWNEVKTIAGSMLDLAMDLPDPHPSHTEEYVLYHTDPVESSGFCIHYKLPHYVTFGSSLDAMRAVGEAKKMKTGDDYYGDGSNLLAGLPGTYAEDAGAAPIPVSAHP